MSENHRPQGQPSTLLICVNYHREADTRHFVDQLRQLEAARDVLGVIIVNNSASSGDDKTFSELIRPGELPLEVMNAPQNLGYFGAARHAFENYRGKAESLPEWVILSNTDIVFPDSDFLQRLRDFEPPGRAAVLAPRIRSSLTGRDQNPYMKERPSPARMRFLKFVLGSPGLNFTYQLLGAGKQVCVNWLCGLRPDRVSKAAPASIEIIYAPHGAFLIFHRSYFEHGGSFEHGVFLFGEEITVAETARRLGLQVLYVPSLVIEHREHASTGLLRTARMRRFVSEASRYCADTYFRDEG